MSSSSSSSSWISAASTAAFGSIPVPILSDWTPASFYNGCQLYLKSLILALPALFFFNAPFGRFAIHDSILRLPGRVAFAFMEMPGPILCILALASSNQLSNESISESRYFFSSILQPSWAHLKQLPIANLILGALYVIHYTHRAILQPIFGPKRSPSHVSVFVSAFIFQSCNGFTLGSWLGGRSPALLIPTNLLSIKEATKAANPLKATGWFAAILPKSKAASLSPTSSVLPLAQPGLLPPGISTILHPTFLIGVTGWAVFFLANAYHDEILFNLRRPAKRGDGPAQGTRANVHKDEVVENKNSSPRYEIPEGGLYALISYPNYFTECELRKTNENKRSMGILVLTVIRLQGLEWSSFALAALSQSPLSPLSSRNLPLTTLGRLSLLFTSPPLLFPILEVAVMLPRAVKGHQWYQSKFGVQGDGKGGRYPKERKAVIPYLI